MIMDYVIAGVACFIAGTWFGLFLGALINKAGR